MQVVKQESFGVLMLSYGMRNHKQASLMALKQLSFLLMLLLLGNDNYISSFSKHTSFGVLMFVIAS